MESAISSTVATVAKRDILIFLAVTLASTIALGACGLLIYNRASQDPLGPADAIVVLGGEHDGREEYAMSLARDGYASTVVLSNPYPANDPAMAGYCNAKHDRFQVICRAPVPSTTRGEAILAGELARTHQWSKIIVVTWQFHLPRSRFIFSQCYSPQAGSVMFRAVPRHYEYSPARWAYVYTYQYAGLIKAAVQGQCH